MMDAPFSVTDLMGRWKCSKDSLKKMEKERDFWKGKCAELENLVQKIHGITEGTK